MADFARMPAVALGLALVAVQTAMVCASSGAPTPATSYRSLLQFDSGFYVHIAANGYRSTHPPVPGDMDRANAAFFPGLSMLARSTSRLLGVSLNIALVVVAQLACWGFWSYVLLFCQRWRVPGHLAGLAVTVLALHPAAFFLVAGYSESLFLCSLLGFIYWSDRPGALPWLLAAIHGFGMTATRIVGLPLAVYPLVALVLRQRGTDFGVRRHETFRAVALTALALAGGLSFFAFCQLRLGGWDLYLQSQAALWGVRVDYLSLFRLDTYTLCLRRFEAGRLGPNDLSRLSVPLTVLALVGVLCWEWRRARHGSDSGWRSRAWYYAAAVLMFYLSVCGVRSRELVSMVRYSFPVFVMLVLAAVHALRNAGSFDRRVRFSTAVSALLVALALGVLELKLAYQFTHGLWVA